MSVLKDSDSQLENVTFFHQALDKAIAYRLSFAQREAQNHRLLEREMPNLWEAIRQSYRHQAWEQVSAFRDALQPFLDLRGYWAQSLTLNEWACEAAQALGDAVNAVRWTHDRADILHQRGEYREAERLYQACEEAYRALGENAMALKSRHQRSLVVRAQGRVTEAEQLCRTTISEARDLGLDVQPTALPNVVELAHISSVKHPMPKRQGFLHSPTSGTYPQWLVWDTSCPIHSSLLLVAMQDIVK